MALLEQSVLNTNEPPINTQDDEFYQNLCKIVLQKMTEESPTQDIATDTTALESFLRQYFVNSADVCDTELSEECERIQALWQLLQNRRCPQGDVIIRTDVSSSSAAGNLTLLILHNDARYLVESLHIALRELGLEIHCARSTVLQVSRDGDGRLLHVDGTLTEERVSPKKQTPNKLLHAEAIIQFDVNPRDTALSAEDMIREIRRTLGFVAKVECDRDSIESLARESAEVIGSSVGTLEFPANEVSAFLHWLNRGVFTFLGACEIRYHSVHTDLKRADSNKRTLGLTPGYVGQHTMPPRLNLGSGIAFLRSGERSRVYRSVYPDCIVLPLLGENGEVLGERHFVGLFKPQFARLNPADIPLLRQKINSVVAMAGYPPDGHNSRLLRKVLDTLPKEELLQCSPGELLRLATAIAKHYDRHVVSVHLRPEPGGEFVSCLVYIPHEAYSSNNRLKIQNAIGARLGAIDCVSSTHFSDSAQVRIQCVFRSSGNHSITCDVESIRGEVEALARSWQDSFRYELIEQAGCNGAMALYRQFEDAFPASYREDFSPHSAASDTRIMAQLHHNNPSEVLLCRHSGGGDEEASIFQLKLYIQGARMALSRSIAVLENFGFQVVSEHPYSIVGSSGQAVWLHHFKLSHDDMTGLELKQCQHGFQSAFKAVLSGQCENDSLNRLVLLAGLRWEEVALLRAYSRYLKQIGLNMGQAYIADTLVKHRDASKNLIELFHALFDPTGHTRAGENDAERLQTDFSEYLDLVLVLNEDQVLRYFLALVNATLRTNYYQGDFESNSDGSCKSYLSLKLRPGNIPGLPKPAPLFEVFVCSPRVEGVHLRGGPVARGGLRWSDRQEDYRTEILGLVKAQQVKNAVIVPAGAKGGFITKQSASMTSLKARHREGRECYQLFIRGLLDITDNHKAGEIVKPPNVVCRDGDDAYLVVAADKGTSSFSDVANAISAEYDFWLGDAFASGGSAGYDHKKMGITAKGAWVAVERHFREQGKNIRHQPFTAVGIGDMSGDVFGNGMLLSRATQLVAAFNHKHIFIDPNPDRESSYEERRRLFQLPGSGWNDYDQSLISAGGGVFLRSAKTIAISPQMQALFDISETKLAPTEVIRHLLRARVDLIWNGGIGCYVKASNETDMDVGDKTNDCLRINGNQLRCLVFGEGGNLGLTQKGRIEYSLQGGACNTDFIDNAGGVDSSDSEVNIKILLNGLVSLGLMDLPQRNRLLENMTEAVEALVLRNCYRQTRCLSLAEKHQIDRAGEYRRYLDRLLAEGKLSRELEALPTQKTLVSRATEGKTLTRPELSVLISHSKILLKRALADSPLVTAPEAAEYLRLAFPAQLYADHRDALMEHSLASAIIAKQMSNDIVDTMGPTFCYRLSEAVGASHTEIARAYLMVRKLFGLPQLLSDIDRLDDQIPAELQYRLLNAVVQHVSRGTRWFLLNRPVQMSTLAMLQPQVERLFTALPEILRKLPGECGLNRVEALMNDGVSEAAASLSSLTSDAFSLLNIAQIAHARGVEVERVAEVYFAAEQTLGLSVMASNIGNINTDNYWASMARESFLDDLHSKVQGIVMDIMPSIHPTGDSDGVQRVAQWAFRHQQRIKRWSRVVRELQESPKVDMAMFTVGLRELALLHGDTSLELASTPA